MKVTEATKQTLHHCRTTKQWKSEGFEEVGEGGGKLWQIYRGVRVGQHITEARIAPDGLSVYVKIE